MDILSEHSATIAKIVSFANGRPEVNARYELVPIADGLEDGIDGIFSTRNKGNKPHCRLVQSMLPLFFCRRKFGVSTDVGQIQND